MKLLKMTGVGKQEMTKMLFEIILFISSIYGTNGGVSGPVIMASSKYFFRGETFSLNCTVHTQKELPIKWVCPSTTRDCKAWPDVRLGTDVISRITIVNATVEDEGNYTCESNSTKISFKKEYLDRPKLKIDIARSARAYNKNGKSVIEKSMKLPKLSLSMSVDAYPEPITYFLRDGQNISILNPRYTVEKRNTGDIVLTITNLTWTDIATYTFVAVNSLGTKNLTFDLVLNAAPVASFTSTVPFNKTINETLRLSCNIYSGDEKSPEIKWTFVAENGKEMVLDECNKNVSKYQVQSFIELQVQKSGEIICSGKNKWGISNNATCKINAYEIDNGFGIKDGPRWYPERDDVTLECIASKYDYTNVTWERRNSNVSYYENGLSHVAVLKINSIRLSQSGNYTCVGIGSEKKTGSVYIEVEANRKPRVADPNTEKIKTSLSQLVQLLCQADAVPPPQITWYKDNVKIVNGTGGLEVTERLNQTVLTSVIAMTFTNETQQGEYKCIAENREGYDTKIVILMIPGDLSLYIAIFGVILFTFMAILIYLTWKVKQEKQLRKELAAAGLLYFKEGALKSINPDLNVDEQAEHLPYDERFEFPAEKLILGKQLGAGAFGVVYKAEARGILNAEETTTVAVKTVNKTADNMYIKALASELKIMVHLGKHVNIVNLLGACTKNIAKRELMVIVEYCRFGNIHNYLIKHREVFVNHLASNSKNENFGHDNRAYTCSVDSGMHTGCSSFSDSQTTDQTFLNTAASSRPVRKASEGYVQQPEWRTNYESDYQTTAPRPLFSRDLLAWAFQIARGMEYLASRKVLHGDLAARNVVLADDNVVKICDFGLARSIYKNDEYKKKSDSLLPLKWLAIECLTDRIFSKQSDVWSFGIVLWELFSLAKTPYPSQLEPSDLYQFLISGKRLDKPNYADDRLYAVMQKCWKEKPKQRPSFMELQEELGSFLEEADRNRYIHLNSSYEDQNAKTTGQDLLAMMNSPDYNNLVTPSPCGYENFFPQSPKSPQDHEGYLLSTRNSNFTFDTQNNHKTPARLSYDAMELTPMLNLDNIPEAGSHSDQDDGHSPHQNFPRIEEEVDKEKYEEELDEVFDIKLNTTRNIDNTNAVSNVTYVTLDDLGLNPATKSQNTYVNTIPKILVK